MNCLGGKCANNYENKVSLLLALHVSTSYSSSTTGDPEHVAWISPQQPLPGGSRGWCSAAAAASVDFLDFPDFWPSNPILWFARAEFNFEVAGVITEREKFMHTASALPYDAFTLVADLITQPPAA